DYPYLNVVFDEPLEVRGNKSSQQAEDEADFFLGAAPVLGREAEHGQVANAIADAQLDEAPQRLHALDVPLGARTAARLRPASVAIHDDADMSRNPQARHMAGLSDDRGVAGHLCPSWALFAGQPRPA